MHWWNSAAYRKSEMLLEMCPRISTATAGFSLDLDGVLDDAVQIHRRTASILQPIADRRSRRGQCHIQPHTVEGGQRQSES